jgi:hypothetical protein
MVAKLKEKPAATRARKRIAEMSARFGEVAEELAETAKLAVLTVKSSDHDTMGMRMRAYEAIQLALQLQTIATRANEANDSLYPYKWEV